MHKTEISNYKKLILHKKKKRKRILLIVISGLITCFGFYAFYNIVNGFSLFALNVKTLECPQYVDEQLINIGKARTGTKLKKIRNIVVHYVGNPGTTAQNNRDYFAKSDTEVCSHFVVGLDGEIIQCIPIDEKSAASNNRNFDTLSIEVCHSDNTGKFNDATYVSLVKLTAWLCDNSRLNSSDIIRHYDITGKECPKYFVDNQEAWENFINDVKTELKKY